MNRSVTFLSFLIGFPLVVNFASVALSSDAKSNNAIRGSLCKAGEEVIFQCSIGRRMASVCAVTLSDGPTAQYRFGRRGDVELALPKNGHTLTWARTGYSGGGELQINANSGTYRYVLYGRVVRTGFGPEGNNPQLETGVAVLHRNKLVSDRSCNDPDKDGFLGKVEKVMPEGEFTRWSDIDQ